MTNAKCVRCQGRMVSERDWAGAFLTCMMCGYVVNDAAILDRRFGTRIEAAAVAATARS